MLYAKDLKRRLLHLGYCIIVSQNRSVFCRTLSYILFSVIIFLLWFRFFFERKHIFVLFNLLQRGVFSYFFDTPSFSSRLFLHDLPPYGQYLFDFSIFIFTKFIYLFFAQGKYLQMYYFSRCSYSMLFVPCFEYFFLIVYTRITRTYFLFSNHLDFFQPKNFCEILRIF